MSAPIPVFGDRPKAVATPKLRALVKYPGNILGGTGIDVTKANGTVTVDMQWDEFGTISAIPTSPTSNILTFDTATKEYVMVPSHLLGGAASGIADVTIAGNYMRTPGSWVSADFLQAGTGAVTRTMQNKARERVSALDFGADNTGSTDCHAALQAWLDYLAINGGLGYLPAGTYKLLTGLVINNNITATAQLNRISITGDGSGNTRLLWLGTSGAALTYRGSTTDGAFGGIIQIEKIQIFGNGPANGLVIQQAAQVSIRDCFIWQNLTGITFIDVLETSVWNCVSLFNKNGLLASASGSPNSPPNSISFYSCELSNNSDIGVNIAGCASVNFYGGAIEGNGLEGDASGPPGQRWGVRIDCSGSALVDGAVAATFNGIYFEANTNVADIWFEAGGVGSGATSVLVQGCMFNRNIPSQYVQNNIRMDLVGTGDKARLTLIGNGFRSFNGYVPSASRPYAVVNAGGANNYNVVDIGNTYADNVEKPVFLGPAKTEAAMSTCWVNFAVSGGTVIVSESFNVGALTRSSAGVFRLAFQRPMGSYTYALVGSVNSVGSVCVSNPNFAYVDFVTLDGAGTPTDFTNNNVVIFGSGDVT